MAEAWQVCAHIIATHPYSTILSVCNLLVSFFRNDVAMGSRWPHLICANFAGLSLCYFVEAFMDRQVSRQKLGFLVVLVASNAYYLRSLHLPPFVDLVGSIACICILSIECSVVARDAVQLLPPE